MGRNLSRRGSAWRYRRGVPLDLRQRAGRREVVRGLGPVSLGEALTAAARLNTALDAFVQTARLDPSFDLRCAVENLRVAATAFAGAPVGLWGGAGVSPRREPASPDVSPLNRAPTLSEALTHYEREQWATGRWREGKAGRAAMAELRRFLDFVGDKPLCEITRDEIRAFRDHRGETLRASTLNIKVVSRLVALFNHCRGEGWITQLPTAGLRVRDGVSRRDRRRPFTVRELEQVFGPSWAQECRGDDHKLHCGRLLLATGARVEEIAQLRLEDIGREPDRVAITITDRHPEQHLKNAASRRVIPLHSALVPGFARYLESVENAGHEWLFHRWSRTPTQPRSAPLVKTFGPYLRKRCGITDRRVVLHSLRHSFKQQLQEVGAPDSLIADVLGHTHPGHTHGTYGDATNIETMSEWIERLPLAGILGSGLE
ncbi:MAG: tyrosine-type recombinase/integrase [bacterium]